MILLNASNIKKMFLDETLFDNVSFNVDSSDKIGFVGINGAGKSTLFRIITGEMDYDSGELFKNKFTKIGYLDQYACSESEKTIMDEMMTVFDEVISIENQLEDIRLEIETKPADLDSLISRQVKLQERYSELDGFFYKSKIKSTLTGLGFSEDEFNLRVSNLSGGQKTRVALAKILLSDANLLLLDEPTNHLDIESVEWLEGFLQNCKCAFIVISHDRYFLDRVTNKTLALENGCLKSYNGNYSTYIEQREIERKSEQRNYDNTMREIERLEGIVEQQRRWNREKNIKTAQSKQKIIDKLESGLIKPMSEADELTFSFKACPGGGQDVLVCEGLGMAFDGKRIFKNANMFIKKGEKVFLLGPNGCGKTTLLKILMGMYSQTEGTYKIGSNIHIGYYDQIQENLNMDKTVIDEVWDEYPKLTQTEIRNALAVFLFRGEDVFKEIRSLSGGERARVELVKLMLKSVNFLIMDEPTNHLDIESREALEKSLENYDGTMLMVSHDRYFINKLADRILYLNADGITSFVGNYDEFSNKYHAVEEKTDVKEPERGLDYKEQKRLEAQKRKILNDYKKTEEKISDIESKIKEIEEEMSKPEIATDFVKATEFAQQSDDLNKELDNLYTIWENLQTAIEENGYEI
jgi:ATP-binding cassette subfamily F protein 3